jgi:pseudouridine-5'-phosphate glycosidase
MNFLLFIPRKSGFGVDYRIDSPEEMAQTLKAKWDLKLKGGLIIANPIPEAYAMDLDTITKAIEEALKQAQRDGIKGKESTPYLLAKVKELTGGDSLDSNIQLVYNNAKVGAQVAVALAKIS